MGVAAGADLGVPRVSSGSACLDGAAPCGHTSRVKVSDYDDRLRAAMFAYVNRLAPTDHDVVTSAQLQAFEFEGKRISLLQPMRGIRVVAGLPAALSIRTTYRSDPSQLPYDDSVGEDGYYRYKWRGTERDAFDNKALRQALELQKPLLWFVGVRSGVFLPLPVWLVGEEPNNHQFVVALDDIMREQWAGPGMLEHPADLALRRRYAEVTVKQRLHQPVFRQRVLAAYRSQCAVCHLRHDELLDAAHIKEDSDGGQPIVPNGLAMCAIHHRAFDSNVLGITPAYEVQIRPDILEEHDGPTLRYALQGLHKAKLHVPTHKTARPSADLLEERFERFRAAS